MTISVTTPVTGAAQTGFTSPTYTVAQDNAPEANAKQWAVTALGGTQTGVTAHSLASPFLLSFWKPKSFKQLGAPNPNTNVLSQVPKNRFKIVVLKGVIPLAGQAAQNMTLRLEAEIPAGADTADPANIRAALSLLFGAASQQSAGFGDTVINGLM